MFWKKDEEFYLNKGKEYYKKENFNESINYYLKAIELNPNNFATYIMIGLIYEMIEDFEKAIDYYTCAIKIKPKDSMAYINRGKIYSFNEKYEEAITDFSAAIDINNENLSVSNKDNCHNSLNNEKIPILYNRLQNLINLDNEVKIEQIILGYYYRGKCNMKLKNNKVAINDFDKMIEFLENNIDLKNQYINKYVKAFFLRGKCKFDCEDYNSANIDFNKFIEYSEKNNM